VAGHIPDVAVARNDMARRQWRCAVVVKARRCDAGQDNVAVTVGVCLVARSCDLTLDAARSVERGRSTTSSRSTMWSASVASSRHGQTSRRRDDEAGLEERLGAATRGGEADAARSRASVVGAVDGVVARLGVGFNGVETLLAWTRTRWCSCVARL
jgi:hypothetical protein